MKLHDLRNGRKATTPLQPNDLVVIGDGAHCHINRVVAYGQSLRLHLAEQVTADVAQAIIDTGGEWCDRCQEHLATEIVTLGDLELFDTAICPACVEAERELLTADYAETLADFEAGTGRI